ncbi:MAG: hypothetical protein RLW68_00460 [Devosia marina]|uniref:hypothetical protein n=1 Tax=Devosia marina TaxID=2683198 RepID=UPI0032EE6ACF
MSEQFEALDQPYQAYSLVGLYLQQFSIMESGVGRLLAALLTLNRTQANIITANMEFSAKAFTCRSLLKIALPGDKDADKAMVDLVDVHAKRRNIIAHSVFFWPEIGSGVKLHKVRAKGELKLEQETISAGALIDEASALMNMSNYLETLVAKVEHQTDLLDRIAAAPGIKREEGPWWRGSGLQGEPNVPLPPGRTREFNVPSLPDPIPGSDEPSGSKES